MGLPDWVKTEDWDILRLGGMRIPGIAKVKAKIGSGLDHKKPKGGKKATTKDDGDPLVEFDVDLDMSHEDVVAFADMVGVLRPVTKSGARSPLKFEHPQAYLWSVFNVSVADIDADHPESGGRMKISLKLVEWAPAPTAVAASTKKPEDAGDVGAWAAFADDAVGRFLHGSSPPAEPAPTKPSSNAGKNL